MPNAGNFYGFNFVSVKQFNTIRFKLFSLVFGLLTVLIITSVVSFQFSKIQKSSLNFEFLLFTAEEIFHYQQQFILKKDSNYLAKIDSLNFLYSTSIKPFTDKDLKARKVNDLVEEINEIFDEIRSKLIERGLNENKGLEAKFREKAHDLEKVFRESNHYTNHVLLLQLRRNEKDYFLRRKTQYLTAIDSISRILVEKSSNAAEINMVMDYLSHFKDVYFINQRIEDLQKKIQEKKISSKNIFNQIKAEKDAEVLRLENLLMLLTILTLLAGISAAFFTYFSIIKQLKELNESALQLAEGNYDAPINIHLNNEIGQISVSMDLMRNEIKNSYQRLENKAEEAQNLAKTKTMFLANMSHEIRTPLNSIIGFSDLISKTNLNQQQKEFINTIHFSSKHLLALINQILDYSKLESGKLEVELIEIDLNEFLVSIISMFKQKASQKKIDLILNLNFNCDKKVINDSIKLTEILSNLLENAIKFTERGCVTLNCNLINIDNENHLSFEVIDTGIGIEPQKQEVIFEEFVQADLATTRKYGGTGLGLTISKKLVKLLNGEIYLQSLPGKGSKFEVVLPVKWGENIVKQHNLPIRTQFDISGMKALVVDDDVVNQLLAKNILKKWQIEVTEALDGQQALNILENNCIYDFVLMDVHMPVLDGVETTKRIRQNQHSYFKNLNIIALTANFNNETREQMLSVGADYFLNKPIIINDLRSILEQITQKKSIEA